MRKTIVELYKSKGQYRWRMRDYRNRKIIGASTEGYKRQRTALNNLYRIFNAFVETDNAELLHFGRVVVDA